MQLPGLPELTWLPGPGEGRATVDGAALTMIAPAGSDWFNDPGGPSRNASAPVLTLPADDDLQLAARVTVDFASAFDAGVLFVHQGPDDHAKLCSRRIGIGDRQPRGSREARDDHERPPPTQRVADERHREP